MNTTHAGDFELFKRTTIPRLLRTRWSRGFALAWSLALTVPAIAATGGLVEATLNGLKITIDEQTGSIVGLEYPGPGKILEAKPAVAGIIDVAYPIPEFEPLRLASRFSTSAKIEKTDDSVTISWANLGASRPYFKADGKVTAKVWLKAMPDGRSIAMKCQIANDSKRPVGQVLFPDLHGLLPFAGKEETCLRTAGFVRKPFVDVQATTYPEFYALDRLSDTKEMVEFYGGGKYGDADSMIGRWLDFGGLNGGISLFPEVWADAPLTKVRVYRLEKDPNVRLMLMHDTAVKPGQTWESPEYVLTPHRNGWAKGIEPYREFVRDHIKRQFPVPQHVREGLGYRTIWMCKGYPADGARDVAFKASDLPQVAAEAKAHGLDELVLWFWQEPFTLPTPPPYSHLGTPEEFSNAIKECNKLGVNVSLFISVVSIAEPTASRYGWKVGSSGWTYHTEFVPRFNPPYANARGTRGVQTTDKAFPLWRQDVLTSVKSIYDQYSHSICWDQANSALEGVFKKFLPWAKERDPRATFSGEIIGSSEKSASFLDYTWNWEGGSYHHNLMAAYRDDRAFTASFPSPRLNKNINRNAQHIKFYFMDNSYINVMPNAPDDANGTASIKDYPEVSRVLKQCAGLRAQFLPCFTEGTLIGDCLLQKPCRGTHIDAYVLPDRVLFMLMNTQDEARAVDFNIDLQPWIESRTGRYEIVSYDQYGAKLSAGTTIGGQWSGKTATLAKYDLAVFELIAK
ncbi:MAG TPA: hypothetical protein VFC44_00345 [Candidatus Saccharimonadales bacterium]|nr:hypothetical protein [Candidatus Saccharimonadales bacterium]